MQLFRVLPNFLPNFHECFYNSMFSISFRKYRDEEEEKQLVYFDHQNVNSLCRAIITSTARASSVFLWSYRKTVLNQSACVFALGYFLKPFRTGKMRTATQVCFACSQI